MLKMGSLASAENGGDREEDEETCMVTDTDKGRSSPSPALNDGLVKKEGGGDEDVKVKSEDCGGGGVKTEIYKEGGQVKSEDFKKEGEVKCEDFKDVEKVLVEMVLKVKQEEGEIKSEENIKTEENTKKIDKNEEEDEDDIVDVEEEEGNMVVEVEEDSVNITEMPPTEGPQEMEEELSKNVEGGTEEKAEEDGVKIDDLQDNQSETLEDDTITTATISGSGSSKESKFEEDVDEDVAEAVECIANQVARENIQLSLTPPPSSPPQPVVMETEEEEDPVPVETTMENEQAIGPPPNSPVPEKVVPVPKLVIPEIIVTPPEIVVPASEKIVPVLETVVPTPKTVTPPPAPTPPIIEVDPEVPRLKKELSRLQACLIWERGSKAELSNKLKKSQEELALKTKNLTEAENKLWERHTAAASLIERDSQLKELQTNYNKIMDDKGTLQNKYDHLQNSLVDIGQEFYGIYETLQNHFKICTVNGPQMVPLTPHEALQRRVDDLTTSVHERYKFWNAEQHKMSEELGDTKKTMEELIEFLEVAEEKKPVEKVDQALSPISSPIKEKTQKKTKKKKELKCDLCRNSFSNKTILKRHRKSCGDAVAGTSSSSNPATPAPISNDSDSDDIAIIEDDYDDGPPPSPPTPTIIDSDSSDDEILRSPKVPPSRRSSTIPQPPTSPPIVMSKIAMSFAPPSIPPSPRSKKRRSSSIMVVDEVDTTSTITSTITSTRESRKRKQINENPADVPEKPSAKKSAKVKKIQTPPPSPSPPPPSPPTSPLKKKKKKKKSKGKVIGHAEDTTKELTCTCGKDFINKYHLKTHIEKESANATTPTQPTVTTVAPTPPPKKSPKEMMAAVVMVTNVSKPVEVERERDRKKNQVSRKNSDEDESENKMDKKRRTISISDGDEEETRSPEETNLRSSKRLKKIKETPSTPATPPEPSPSPRKRKQNGGGSARSTKAVEVSSRSPLKKSPTKKGTKELDRSPKKVVHEQDYSKSARRGLFCKCGLNFQSRRKLNIHLFCRKSEENEGEKESGGNENGNGAAGFNCTSCGENFESNAERIKHRMVAHGHGLNS